MVREKAQFTMGSTTMDMLEDEVVKAQGRRWRLRLRNTWACSAYTLVTTALGFAAFFLMLQSFLTKQLDTKGCEMVYMRPMYSKFDDFDTEHTRFASKYSLYLYREWGIDEEFTVKGAPVLFIPGNAGSYKQVRSLAAESAYHYHNSVQHESNAGKGERRPLDFFAVDFNEDFTAFHGQTVLDQAEYLNDAITFILSLYHTPGRSRRDPHLPDPTSVIIVGHSMGGVVARTLFTMPNYQANSINTIVTIAASHARPPVSFDGDIIRTQNAVNNYWRNAYAQDSAKDNPLEHVTLVSIAGGGLDNIVSSDYASIASIVPETHGFTVFSSSIPNCWTGADHLAITWCDQVRKSIVRALYDVVDVSQAMQTLPVTNRMRFFKKWFLTGLEDIAEKTLPMTTEATLLTVDVDTAILPQEEQLVLRSLGRSSPNIKAFLLPVPPRDHGEKIFALLTNERLDGPGEHGRLEVLFCSMSSAQSTQSYLTHLDLAGESPTATKLACKNAASDVIILPESTSHSNFPFRPDQAPFSYLQYDVRDLAPYQFVAVLDKAAHHSAGWVFAGFSASSEATVKVNSSLQRLLYTGVSLQLPPRRPLTTNISVPALHSSLLAYDVHISRQKCSQGELFAPLLRQYISDLYESKFFVNVEDAMINVHGVSPYLPAALSSKSPSNGLSLQIWADPTCDSSIDVTLKVDFLGSLGKLWMRYRIVFAAFPLLVVALVLRQQFRTYDATGVFISFAQSLDECTYSSLPLAITALTFLSITLATAQMQSKKLQALGGPASIIGAFFDNDNNELLLGSEDPFFWFLVPLFGIMCTAICVMVNYVVLILTYLFATLYALVRSNRLLDASGQRTPEAFAATSTRRRIITTLILLSLISTAIPYHFAYVVLCIVQLATCIRGFRLAKETQLDTNYNFYNYAHSIFILMLWILPINLPVLVVWIRNLAIQWLTPFSSHHNVLSITPFILLVETLSTGRMVPRVRRGISLFTNVFLFAIGAYAAVYGVTYAYVLHHLANILCAWLVAIHFDTSGLAFEDSSEGVEVVGGGSEGKKRP
ncbi:GPI inositol-deacylase [Parastagonospora nodorum]|nr:GPI inositol-deacylase [Parastagonospora nodorum]KAH4018943.1 GPI inositol-deacylase [Parastagonospora nodorum]KAH4345254.1 GPI inositol-deacylase [Parastagonospora nodorum]KAH4375013.1 GPI inositol-deacylase [Parastagonospora nodorum]KAH4394396.1 GPI inositol-deacylase [Parastagonospora nodorum]